MRASLLLALALAHFVGTTSALAAVTTIRTGQVGGSPGTCSGSDDSFHYYAPNQNCGQPILATAFQASDFAMACSGPQAVVINPASPPWVASLDCDPEARWIATGLVPGSCLGEAISALYCARFTVETQCTVADSIRICWAVDDFLGDPASFPGPNPGGIYINGVDLGPSFSGPGSNPTYTAVAYNVPLNGGANSLAVYQRDAGCSISGLILSAKVYTTCGTVGTEVQNWGNIKSIYRD